jgi:FixJ family two-component response regulator
MGPTNEMVYIVDDDASVGEVLSNLLRANGKGVRVFTSGREFLDFERLDSCACLILNLIMPDMNGLEVQRHISIEAIIPVIFITGRVDIRSTVTAMKSGAVDVLTKPVDEVELLSCIERALKLGRVYRKEALEHAQLRARY